ncbi:TPA: DUF2313 domain-containing protein [Citrobacter freundii]|nr:DUF2313 domain-containing protein [Citrobacter freundii]
MAHSTEEWLIALQQAMPRGKAWPSENDAYLTRFLRAVAARLHRAECDASRLSVEMRPETTLQLLPEWESYLGLPECSSVTSTTEERRRAVAEKHRRRGGLEPWKIEQVAAALGFSIRVTVILPHHCMRNCLEALYPARYRWLLRVDVLEGDTGRFTCTDNVLTPLFSDYARILECHLTRYRLAGSAYEYIYYGDRNVSC